jgi:DNA repair protein RadD
MKTLRPHQTRAIEMLRDSLTTGHRKPMLQLSVAAGKTVIAAAIVRNAMAKGKRVIFAADAISLIDQTVNAFWSEGISDIGVLQGNHPMEDYSRRCQVCSIQTLDRRKCPPFDVFIQDEAHMQFAVVREIMEANPNAVFIGLSATPWSKGLGNTWDDLIKPISMQGLVDLGHVMPVTAYAPTSPDWSKTKIKAGDLDEDAVAHVMGGEKIVADAIESWKELGENRPTFAFDVNCATAQSTCDRFNQAGIPWGYINGKTEASDRRQIFRQLDNGEIRGISSVAALIKGVDRVVSCILWRAATKSPIKLVQGIGRALRDNPPWTDAIVIDQTGSLLRLGLPVDIDRATLCTKQKGEKSEGEAAAAILPKPCPKCGKLKTAKICVCGFESKRESDVVEGAGQLGLISGGKKSGPKKDDPTPDDKLKFYAECKFYAQQKGKKPTYADAMHMQRYGHWPARKHDVAPLTPSAETISYIRARNIRYSRGMAKRDRLGNGT